MSDENRTKRSVFAGLLLCVVMLFLTVSAGAHETASTAGTGNMDVVYGVVGVISLGMVLAYCLMAKKKELWLLLLFIAIFVVNLGYFAMAISTTRAEALLANRISYLGAVFLPLCILMIIFNICRIRPHWAGQAVLICVSIAMFLLAASGGYSVQLYYKEVTVVYVGDVLTLDKVYGPLHCLYYVYLFSYLMLMIGAGVYGWKKGKVLSHRSAALLVVLAAGNVAIWLVEQWIPVDFEFLSVSYVISELVILVFYDTMHDPARPVLHTWTEETEAKEDEQAHESEEHGELQELTARETEVLRLLLENKKRKDIAQELFVSENTIKKHTAHIYEKMQVSSRAELLEKCRSK